MRSFRLEPSNPSDPQVVAIAWGTLLLTFIMALVQHQYVAGALIAILAMPRAILLLFGVAKLEHLSTPTYIAAYIVAIYVLYTKTHAQLLPYIQ